MNNPPATNSAEKPGTEKSDCFFSFEHPEFDNCMLHSALKKQKEEQHKEHKYFALTIVMGDDKICARDWTKENTCIEMTIPKCADRTSSVCPEIKDPHWVCVPSKDNNECHPVRSDGCSQKPCVTIAPNDPGDCVEQNTVFQKTEGVKSVLGPHDIGSVRAPMMCVYILPFVTIPHLPHKELTPEQISKMQKESEDGLEKNSKGLAPVPKEPSAEAGAPANPAAKPATPAAPAK